MTYNQCCLIPIVSRNALILCTCHDKTHLRKEIYKTWWHYIVARAFAFVRWFYSSKKNTIRQNQSKTLKCTVCFRRYISWKRFRSIIHRSFAVIKIWEENQNISKTYLLRNILFQIFFAESSLCDIDPEYPSPCGSLGIDRFNCEAQGCCFAESDEDGHTAGYSCFKKQDRCSDRTIECVLHKTKWPVRKWKAKNVGCLSFKVWLLWET